jgi:hypothetical protein
MKVLVIWKALVSTAHHRKIKVLAGFKDVEITLVVPRKWNKVFL